MAEFLSDDFRSFASRSHSGSKPSSSESELLPRDKLAPLFHRPSRPQRCLHPTILGHQYERH